SGTAAAEWRGSHDTPVARPESTRNTYDRRDTVASDVNSPRPAAIPHANRTMTAVRTAVASVDEMPPTPTLARMAVSAANTAETKAKNNQPMWSLLLQA